MKHNLFLLVSLAVRALVLGCTGPEPSPSPTSMPAPSSASTQTPTPTAILTPAPRPAHTPMPTSIATPTPTQLSTSHSPQKNKSLRHLGKRSHLLMVPGEDSGNCALAGPEYLLELYGSTCTGGANW